MTTLGPEETDHEEAPSNPGTTKQRKLISVTMNSTEPLGAPRLSVAIRYTGGKRRANERAQAIYLTRRKRGAWAAGSSGDLLPDRKHQAKTGSPQLTRQDCKRLKPSQFQYGRVEARIQVPAGQGLVAQFWALGNEADEGSEAWPACGEIECGVPGPEPTSSTAVATVGVGADGSRPGQVRMRLSPAHTYGVEWEPEG